MAAQSAHSTETEQSKLVQYSTRNIVLNWCKTKISQDIFSYHSWYRYSTIHIVQSRTVNTKQSSTKITQCKCSTVQYRARVIHSLRNTVTHTHIAHILYNAKIVLSVHIPV